MTVSTTIAAGLFGKRVDAFNDRNFPYLLIAPASFILLLIGSFALIDLVGADAEALGCRSEVLQARRIAREGTSADRQRAVYQGALAAGAEPREALCAIVDALIEEFGAV